MYNINYNLDEYKKNTDKNKIYIIQIENIEVIGNRQDFIYNYFCDYSDEVEKNEKVVGFYSSNENIDINDLNKYLLTLYHY